ncbi:disease resistance protein At4g27190-like [Tasmannia lanceolata]|uniref:disease resistance protein At4g27190-like n=1 Tax=Tasmannia lanceolata TaxID=3420 RepID=UPI0040645952
MHESIYRASFVWGQLSEIPTFLARCSRLSTLFLQGNPLNKIPKDIFLGLKALRVLNLSDTNIESLPKEMGELRALRILNLSGTDINSLPKEVGELNNLRVLNLSWTYELEKIEAQTMSRLSSLEVLDMNESSFGWKVRGEVDEESVTLEELLDLECLYYLRIWVSSIAYFPLDSTWLKRLKGFHFRMSDEAGSFLRTDYERVVEQVGDVEHLTKYGEVMLNIATCLCLEDCFELAKSLPNLEE